MIEKIKKRNGEIVVFNQEKITKAIFSAVESVSKEKGKKGDYLITQRISDKVMGQISALFGNGIVPTVEQTQDLVERQLIKDGYADTAKAYILYRQKHKELRERSELENGLIADVVRTVKDYTRGDDWEVRENANSGSIVFQGLNAHLSGKALKRYALNEMYGKQDPQIKELHEKGAIHIHDLDFPIIAYCCGHSLEKLIKRGFGEVAERVQSAPPKHLETIVAQMVNYIGTMQGEFAGAQAFSSVDTFLAPFVRADNLSQERVDQYMQMLIYGLNVPSRWGWQAPFSNLTFDLVVPDDLKDKKIEIGLTEEDINKKYNNRVDRLNQVAQQWANSPYKEMIPEIIAMVASEFKDNEFEHQKQIAIYRVEPPQRNEMKGLFERIEGTRNSEWKVIELFLDAASLPEKRQREHLINGALDLYKKEKEELKEILNSTYKDYKKEMDMINLGFLKNMVHGDKSGRIFTFPIPTYNITKDFDWDSEVSNLLFEVTGKYGLPYFQNYIGSGLDSKSIRAMCCRLNLDQNELLNRPGGMWGPGESTGSIGVVTINMNRIGYEAQTEEEFFGILGHRMDIASKSLEIKRKTVEGLLEKGFVPYTKSYLGHFANHFSTIGICGMHEACVNFLNKDISTSEGKEFSIKTLKFMRGKIKKYQEDTDNLYNLEATPAESTSYRAAKKDKELYPNIYTSGDAIPFLTNSSQLPVDLEIDLFSALKHQEEIQTLYNGGTLFNAYLGERIEGEMAKKLVRKIAETTRLPYFSVTPIFSICNNHGYISGRHDKCPICSKPAEVWDRIVGYLRPVSSWNEGKQEEFKHRKRFEI